MNTTRVSVGELVTAGALEFGDGYRTKRSEHGLPGYRIIRVADVLENEVRLDGPDFVSELHVRAIGSKIGQPGDILLTTKGTVGRVAVMPPSEEPVVYSPQLCYFRVLDHSVINPQFLRYWFNSQEFWEQASYRMNNTDMAAYINMADIRSLVVTLPSISDQQAIAEVLGALDDKIAANSKLVETLGASFTAHWTALVSFATTETATVGSLLGALIGGDWGTSEATESSQDAVYCIRGADIADLQQSGLGKMPRRFVKPSSLERRRLKDGDLVVEMSGGSPTQSTGRAVLVTDALLERLELPLSSSNFCKIIRPADPENAFYLYGLLRDSWQKGEFFPFENGSTGIKNLAFSDYSSTKVVALPPAEILRSFNKLSRSLFEDMQSVGVESTRLTATRDALLPQFMSGKLQVKKAAEVVATV